MKPPDSNTLPPARFFSVGTERAEGPFDLVELADQLKRAMLNPDSLLCREGEETWIPFRDLPEFATVRKISLEPKVVPPPEPPAPPKRPAPLARKLQLLPWITALVVIFLVGVAVVALTLPRSPKSAPAPSTPVPPPPQAAPAPVQTSWPTTQDDRFSIQGPVLLEKADGPETGAYHYAGKIPGVVFSVVYMETAHVHTLNAVRDKWLRTNHGKIISERRINNHGHEGREVAVLMPEEADTKETGRIRFFVTDHGTFEVFVGAEPGKFSDEEMTKFLDSFEIR